MGADVAARYDERAAEYEAQARSTTDTAAVPMLERSAARLRQQAAEWRAKGARPAPGPLEPIIRRPRTIDEWNARQATWQTVFEWWCEHGVAREHRTLDVENWPDGEADVLEPIEAEFGDWLVEEVQRGRHGELRDVFLRFAPTDWWRRGYLAPEIQRVLLGAARENIARARAILAGAPTDEGRYELDYRMACHNAYMDRLRASVEPDTCESVPAPR